MASLSNKQIRAIIAASKGANKGADTLERDALNVEFASKATEMVEHAVLTLDKTDKDDSTWAGFSRRGIPVTVDGEPFTLAFTLTDVKRSQEKHDALEAEALAILQEQAAPVQQG